jgi:hypothetical protein
MNGTTQNAFTRLSLILPKILFGFIPCDPVRSVDSVAKGPPAASKIVRCTEMTVSFREPSRRS